MSNSFTVYKDEDIKIYMEEEQGEMFVHMRMYRASRSIIEKALKVLAGIKAQMYWAGYENVYTYSADERLLNLLPLWEPVGEFQKDGKTFKVVKWDLK